jgi:endogenous inhibitor of DNA gyrase (YacG/DUF329 family)
MTSKRPCPTCKKLASATLRANEFAPFCSQRCQLVDLGRWLDGDYRIDNSSGSPVSR